VMADEGLPVQAATRMLRVSESRYYRWRNHSASARSLRHAFLTEVIGAVHTASCAVCSYTYRIPRMSCRVVHKWQGLCTGGDKMASSCFSERRVRIVVTHVTVACTVSRWRTESAQWLSLEGFTGARSVERAVGAPLYTGSSKLVMLPGLCSGLGP
jgi:hypothetical protein